MRYRFSGGVIAAIAAESVVAGLLLLAAISVIIPFFTRDGEDKDEKGKKKGVESDVESIGGTFDQPSSSKTIN